VRRQRTEEEEQELRLLKLLNDANDAKSLKRWQEQENEHAREKHNKLVVARLQRETAEKRARNVPDVRRANKEIAKREAPRNRGGRTASANRGLRTWKRPGRRSVWAGKFGDEYTARNMTGDQVAFFAPIITRTGPLQSAIEFGPNVGLNLMALRAILPDIELAGVEINPRTAELLRMNVPGAQVFLGDAAEFATERQYDLVLTKSFLIHVSPERIQRVYGRMRQCCAKYILIAEYYNPRLVGAKYRDTFLWKRDFAGEMMERFPELRLMDYGFVYHRDEFPQDDITWFLLRRAPSSATAQA
jgi:spore coat polysaccharide biosynthesis protein SpsF